MTLDIELYKLQTKLRYLDLWNYMFKTPFPFTDVTYTLAVLMSVSLSGPY